MSYHDDEEFTDEDLLDLDVDFGPFKFRSDIIKDVEAGVCDDCVSASLDMEPYLRMHEYPTEDEEGTWEFSVMDSDALGRTRRFTGRFMDGVRWVKAWAAKEGHYSLALLDKEEG